MRNLTFGLFLITLVLALALMGTVAADTVTISDPKGDLLNYPNPTPSCPTTCDPYVDIVEAGVTQDGNDYVATIKLAANLPTKLDDPTLVIDWVLLIDADRNPNTPNVKNPLKVNDITGDVIIRLILKEQNNWSGQIVFVVNATDQRTEPFPYQISGNTVKFTFSPEKIGSTNFDFAFLARKFGKGGAQESLIIFDRAPNQGHATFKWTPVTAQSATVQTTAVSSSTQSMTGKPESSNLYLIIATLAAVVVLSALALFLARRRSALAKTTQKSGATAQVVEPGIPTGYDELDQLLAGGLPVGSAILILSASWDEKDLLLERIISSSISTGRPVFYVSSDINTSREMIKAHSKDFYAFSPQADKIGIGPQNLFKLPGVGNLSEFNISFMASMKETHTSTEVPKLLAIDMISDVLLRYKSLTTLRWLSEFLAKRKSENFTIVATLNPLIAAKEESQPIIDLFDGVIEIYEKELAERTRRFLVIKKMHGRKYAERDLMLNHNKLF